MKTATKAALISALVIPGAGHIYLKKYTPGFILIGTSAIALYYLVSKATEQALQIVGQMQNGTAPLDIATISELASRQPIGTDPFLLNAATAILFICWIFGIIDSYRVGAIQDKPQ